MASSAQLRLHRPHLRKLRSLRRKGGFQSALPLGRSERGLMAAPAMPRAAQMVHWGPPAWRSRLGFLGQPVEDNFTAECLAVFIFL